MAVLVKVVFDKGDRIPVIKVIREMTNFSLKEGVHAADLGMITVALDLERMMRTFTNTKERLFPDYKINYSFSVEVYDDVGQPVWLPSNFK